MGLNHVEKKYQKVAIKIGMDIAIAIGFVFLIFFILEGLAPPSPGRKEWEAKANGNGNAHANFDRYFLVFFCKMV